MIIYYFDRKPDNSIAGLYRNEQYPGQESLPETDSEIVAWFAAKEAEQAAMEAEQAQKQQAIIGNLPSWAAVASEVDNIANLADAKVFIKKLARLVYWLAKNTKD